MFFYMNSYVYSAVDTIYLCRDPTTEGGTDRMVLEELEVTLINTTLDDTVNGAVQWTDAWHGGSSTKFLAPIYVAPGRSHTLKLSRPVRSPFAWGRVQVGLYEGRDIFFAGYTAYTYR
jgi:hypothetical protein